MRKLIEQIESVISEGWDVMDGASKQDAIDFALDPKRFGSGGKLLKSKMVGKELWSVWYSPDAKQNIIMLDLIEKHGNGYAIKGMSEMEGPYYYKCPKEFLDLAPVDNQSWRDVVLGKKGKEQYAADSVNLYNIQGRGRKERD